jgi:chitinase
MFQLRHDLADRPRPGKTLRCVLLAALLLGLAPLGVTQTREVIGYYPSWKPLTSPAALTPEKIPFDKLTIINYAFFYPVADGTIVGKDSVNDARILGGTPATDDRPAIPGLTALAHRHGVKVMLSLGGWENSGGFPGVAAGAATRVQFAHSCAQRIREYGFDGIDVDWEFPGYAPHNGTTADRENFTLLLRTLRDSLDALGAANGQHFLLTAALPSDSARAAGMDIRSVAALLDFLNIMTYDYHGPWDPVAGHNAPLYAGAGATPAWSVHGSFVLYHTSFGIPADRMTLGVPFYGHSYRNCTALQTPHGGSDTARFPEGAFATAILASMKDFARSWDDLAKVPFLVDTTSRTLVSYDDEESIRWKVRYARENSVRGFIIWEITADYLPDGSTPLLDALTRALHD